MPLMLVVKCCSAGKKKEQPSFFISDKLQQDGTKVQPRFYSQAYPLLRAAGGVNVYAVGALHEVYQQCFSKLRAKKKKLCRPCFKLCTTCFVYTSTVGFTQSHDFQNTFILL